MKQAMFVTSDSELSKLVQSVLMSDDSIVHGRNTYLRSLVASTQLELGARPLRAAQMGRPKGVTAQEALSAFSKVNERFYGIVLKQLPRRMDPQERNAKSNFARSAASTLRSALRLGLNPLSLVLPDTTKASLRAWIDEHRPEPTLKIASAERQAKKLVERLKLLLERLPEERDRTTVLIQLQRDLTALDTGMDFLPRERTEKAKNRASH